LFLSWQLVLPRRVKEPLIRPATLKALIESKLEMDKSEVKNDFLELVKYLEEMAIVHDEHCHVVEQKKTGDSGMESHCMVDRHDTGPPPYITFPVVDLRLFPARTNES
jgi:hypothetical protein